MKAFFLAFLAALAALAVGAVALVVAWPHIKGHVVASLNAEVRAQGVTRNAAADAVGGFLDALRGRGATP